MNRYRLTNQPSNQYTDRPTSYRGALAHLKILLYGVSYDRNFAPPKKPPPPEGDKALRMGQEGGMYVRNRSPLYFTGLRPLRSRCPKSNEPRKRSRGVRRVLKGLVIVAFRAYIYI